MNGQSSGKKNIYAKRLYLLTGIYIFVVIALLATIAMVPKMYNSIANRRVRNIMTNVEKIIQLPDSKERTRKLEKLVGSENMDIVVLNQTGYLYQTLPSSDFEVLDEMVNKKSLSYYSSYVVQSNHQDYQVWLAIYEPNAQMFFEHTIVFLVGLIFCLFTVLIIMLLRMFKDIVNPLKRLQVNIVKMKDFNLDEVTSESEFSQFDGLLSELSEFTGNLQEKMDTLGMRYTTLEKNLQAKTERMIYKDQLVGSVIHDLKTPLTLMSMQLEKLENSYQEDEELVGTLQMMQEKNQKTLFEIQNALKLIHTEEVHEEIEAVNINKIVQETLQRFKPILQNKKIYTEIDFPESVYINMAEIEARQLFHNIISNVSQYTKAEGMFELRLDEADGEVKIEVYNDSDGVENIDFEHVFDLFYHTESEENKYSTGVGMYTVKVMVEKYGGNCYFAPKKAGVALTIVFAKEGDRL